MGDSSNWAPMQRPRALVRNTVTSAATITSEASLEGADTAPYRGEALAARLLSQVLRALPGSIAVRLWRGPAFRVGAAPVSTVDRGPGAPEPKFVLVFRNPQAICTMILERDPLRLAEAYFRGDVDIEGDFFAALNLKDHLESMQLPFRDRLGAVLTALRLRALNKQAIPGVASTAPSHGRMVRVHSKDENRDAIQFHYDLSNEFYRLWLDRAMVYSCAYFESPDNSLDEAQQAKLEHIC